MKIIQGTIKPRGQRIAVIASRFNDFITQRLLQGCVEELTKRGVKKNHITVAWVPGSFEIPIVAQKFAKKKNIDAVICLGAVIRGETIHFDLVARAAQEGILMVGLQTQKPVIFGVLTTNTTKQSYSRSEAKGDNKGREAAVTALEMLSILKEV